MNDRNGRVLEYGTRYTIEVGIPRGGLSNIARVIDELKARGVPDSARIVATAGGMDPEDVTITASFECPSEAWEQERSS